MHVLKITLIGNRSHLLVIEGCQLFYLVKRGEVQEDRLCLGTYGDSAEANYNILVECAEATERGMAVIGDGETPR